MDFVVVFLLLFFIKNIVFFFNLHESEALLMRTHNIMFHGKLEKIIQEFSLNIPP